MATLSQVNLRKLNGSQTMVVSIHATREFKARIAVGSWLIKAGCWIIGMKSDIEVVK